MALEETFDLDFGLVANSIDVNDVEMMSIDLVTEDEILNIDFGIVMERDIQYDYYDGSYEVTPKINAQSLNTAEKVMREDLKVKSIPYYEVDNTKGTTVYIGDEINGN